MKDQKRLLNKCLISDIPAFVICGNDNNAIKTLEAYFLCAKEIGCSKDFLSDMLDVIEEFKEYKRQEPDNMRNPD